MEISVTAADFDGVVEAEVSSHGGLRLRKKRTNMGIGENGLCLLVEKLKTQNKSTIAFNAEDSRTSAVAQCAKIDRSEDKRKEVFAASEPIVATAS